MAGIREWDFGTFDTQAADFDADGWYGRSILVWGNGSNQVDTQPDYNTEYVAIGQSGGADTFPNQVVVDIKLPQIKAKLGQIPVLVKVELWLNAYSSGDTFRLDIYRMYTAWDIGDTDNRYKDKSGLITWYEDAYAPFPGEDRTTDRVYVGPTEAYVSAEWLTPANITSVVERALRDNTPIRFMMMGYPGTSTTSCNVNWKPPLTTRRPKLAFYYFYPVEFYESDSGGDIDYASAIQETEDGHYYLGAVERQQTGTPTRCWLRNYTDATQQVELLDDHPEWTTPVQREGTGTGQLDYVTLAENALSQLYTVVFYSATQFEVLAVAYRDNAISNHPTLDATASWRGAVGTDWTSPDGEITIPAAAWQSSGIATDDEIEVGVRGNTTDTSWPADSNDQVEITYDDAGSADALGWRPIVAHRQQTTAQVAVDATSKFVPLRHLVPAEWPIGNKVLLHDSTNMDEGTVSSTQERALAAASHTGTGDDDLTVSGNYNGNANRTYRVQIDAEGSPDTFSWSRDGTTTWVATGVAITGSAQLLEDGVWLTFGGTDNHTLGDYWTFDADTWGLTIGGLTSGSNTYAAGTYCTSALPIRDLVAAVWSTVNAASGVSETPASRIYMDDTTGFTNGDTIFVQQAGGSGLSESATITGTPTATYIDLTADLVNDYTLGDFITKEGTGEAPFWMRPVANSTTVEELKRFRANARML